MYVSTDCVVSGDLGGTDTVSYILASLEHWSHSELLLQIAGTFLTFMLAMTLHPEVQAKARAEIDRVVGDRLPTVADKGGMPYLSAVVSEALRWHPIGPTGG